VRSGIVVWVRTVTATAARIEVTNPRPRRPEVLRPLVMVVEPDEATRMTLVTMLGPEVESAATIAHVAGIVGHPHDRAGGTRAGGDRVDAQVLVLVTGPSIPPPVAASGIASTALALTRGGRWRTVIVGVAHRCSNAMLREALAVGLSDLVGLDAGPDQLRHAVRRAGLGSGVPCHRRTLGESLPPRVVGGQQGSIAVFAPKGGAGASTVAANVAVGLATRCSGSPDPRWVQAAVLVDADLQFGDQSLMLGVDPLRSLASLAGPVQGRSSQPARVDRDSGTHCHDAERFIELLITHRHSGVALLCAPVDPALADTVPVGLVAQAMRAVRSGTPWLVVDLPSHLGDLTLDVIDSTDRLLVVTGTDPTSVKDVRLVADTLHRLGVACDRWTLVCNGVGRHGGLSVTQIEQHVGVPAGALIPDDPAVATSLVRGNPVVLEFPGSAAALAFAALVDGLTNMGEPGDSMAMAADAPSAAAQLMAQVAQRVRMTARAVVPGSGGGDHGPV
jgi:Flp pilus assembly CpaE family ATPase